MIYGAVQFLASDEKKKAIESELVQVFSPVGKVHVIEIWVLISYHYRLLSSHSQLF